MSDANPGGWPDASKPGVPQNPERDGAHVLHNGDILMIRFWHANRQTYTCGPHGMEEAPAAQIAVGRRYWGAVYTPQEVEALVEAARREAAAQEREAAEWVPFDYDTPPEGLCWLEVLRPETWCDAGPDGRDIGGYTGHVDRLVVLADVYRGNAGPGFQEVGDSDFGSVDDGDTVVRYKPVVPPELPAAIRARGGA